PTGTTPTGGAQVASFVVDGAGAAQMVSNIGGWAKVKLDGSINSGSSGAGFDSSYIALESDGTVIGFSGGQFQAVTLPDSGSPVRKWKFASPAGALFNATWPGISPGGLLHAWAEPGGASAPFALTVY